MARSRERAHCPYRYVTTSIKAGRIPNAVKNSQCYGVVREAPCKRFPMKYNAMVNRPFPTPQTKETKSVPIEGRFIATSSPTCHRNSRSNHRSLPLPSPAAPALLPMMLVVLVLVLQKTAKHRPAYGSDESVVRLLPQEIPRRATGDLASQTSLALGRVWVVRRVRINGTLLMLRVVGVGGVCWLTVAGLLLGGVRARSAIAACIWRTAIRYGQSRVDGGNGVVTTH